MPCPPVLESLFSLACARSQPTGTHDGAEVFLRKMEIQDDSHPANQRWTLEVQMEESQAEPGMISEQPRGAAPSTSWRRAGADGESGDVGVFTFETGQLTCTLCR